MTSFQLTPQQKQALEISATIWVTASAGSGKTKVLTDRLLALMMSGVAPSRLLCLTFTKTAAAEMASRLQERLSQWVTLSEKELENALRDLGFRGTPPQKKRARRLFSELLDAPGGFKIQTLHSFCQSLLGRFPLEAGISPYFSVLEEHEAEFILTKAQNNVFECASQENDQILHEALSYVTSQMSEKTLRELIEGCIKGSACEGIDLFQTHQNDEEILKHFFPHVSSQLGEFTLLKSSLTPDERKSFADLLLLGSGGDQEFGQALKEHEGIFKGAFEKENPYLAYFLTQGGEPRKRLISSKLSTLYPFLEEGLRKEQEHLMHLQDFEKDQMVYWKSIAILRLSKAVQARYRDLKKQKIALDYDDLISATIRLLHSSQGALWVLYKLDNGLDHILVDEAQDTSIEQWKVIRGIADVFFETQEESKTLFVVGDPKQSIYSFQGAHPEAFSFMKQHVKETLSALQRRFIDVSLYHSFRSSPAVLKTVDWIFRHSFLSDTLLFRDLEHTAFFEELPGVVEVWPLITCAERDDKESEEEGDALPTVSFETILAQGIAKKILSWLKEGMLLKNGPIRPQDILILVRRRGQLMETIVKACKEVGIPIAGVDRLVLQNSLAIADLMKCAEFCLNPSDDLTVATVLKGPFIRLSEEKLFELCHTRGTRSVWHCLKEKAHADTDTSQLYDCFQAAHAFLSKIQMYSHLSPFSFFSFLVYQEEGKKKCMERLGTEVEDAIDEFLKVSLRYEEKHPPTLQEFLGWMERYPIEIKRNMEGGARDEVRILTIHGAKGLESPIVILPDTTRPPLEAPDFLWLTFQDRRLPCVLPALARTPQRLRSLRDEALKKQEEEYHRLLYVALTRAKEHLYVCGGKKGKQISQKSWYSALSQALSVHPDASTFEFQGPLPAWKGEALRLQTENLHPVCVSEPYPSKEEKAFVSLPEWVLHAPLQSIERKRATVTGLSQTHDVSSLEVYRETNVNEKAIQRGKMVHFFLENLVCIAQEQREEKGTLLIDEFEWDIGLGKKCLTEALLVLSDPKLQWLWQEEGLSEVSVEGQRGDLYLSGRIDRLLVTPQSVYVVDFKTDQNPPSEIPEEYVIQLRAYYSLLTPLYQQPVVCGILWTVSGQLEWLEKRQCEEEMRLVTSIL